MTASEAIAALDRFDHDARVVGFLAAVQPDLVVHAIEVLMLRDLDPAGGPDGGTDMAALTTIGERVRRSTAERDQLIRDAVAAGISQREVARAVGLSHTAIAGIVARGN